MIRLKRILTEINSINIDTLPLRDVTLADCPFITIAFGNYWNAKQVGAGFVMLRLNRIFRSRFGVNIEDVTFMDVDGFGNHQIEIKLSGGPDNSYREIWKPAPKPKTISDEIVRPTWWSIWIDNIKINGYPALVNIDSVRSDITKGHIEILIDSYDKTYIYTKHADGYGEINYYAAKKTGSIGLIRLKPGTKSYKAVKTKVFGDT